MLFSLISFIWSLFSNVLAFVALLLLLNKTYSKLQEWKRKVFYDAKKVRTYFLTGCASGIGKKAAEKLLELGHNVVATDFNVAGLEELEKSLKIKYSDLGARFLAQKLDVTKFEEWENVYSMATNKFKVIDGHLNIAGFLKPGYILNLSQTDIDRHIDVNTSGVIYGTQVAAKHMKANKSGHIINISSIAAYVPFTGCSIYGASKAAVRSFTLAVSRELASHGILVSNVSPGPVATPMLDLQIEYEEATATFMMPYMTPDDLVNQIVNHVIPSGTLDFSCPLSQALLARFGEITFGTPLYDLSMSNPLTFSNAKLRKTQLMESKKMN